MALEAILLTHQFPTYAATRGDAGGLVLERAKDGSGDYVHSLHAQALAERVILARTALRQGRSGKASEILDEAFAYLNRTSHTR